MSEENKKFCSADEVIEERSCPFPKQVLMVVSNVSLAKNNHKTGVWLEEFAVPYQAFLDAGYDVTVASPTGDIAPVDPASVDLLKEVKWKNAIRALNDTQKLDTVDYMVFDALVLPGGHGPMFDLAKCETLGNIVNYFSSKNRLIAAICHGPAGLLPAVKDGISFVNGRRLTCFTNEEEVCAHKEELLPFYLEDELKTAGAFFIQQEVGAVNVVEDDNLITAQNYQSVCAFTDAIMKHLG